MQEKFYQTNNDYGLDLIDSPNCTAANSSATLFIEPRVTVCALKEGRIAVTVKVGDGLLINSAVQESCHIIMPQCVKMKFVRQTEAVIYFAERL